MSCTMMHGSTNIKATPRISDETLLESWVDFKTRQAMYVLRSIEMRSFKHSCSGKAISITHADCMFVALGIHNAMRMSHTVICGLSRSKIFFLIISQRHDFLGGKKCLTIKCMFRVSLKLMSETVCILRITERDMIKNVYWSSYKVL